MGFKKDILLLSPTFKKKDYMNVRLPLKTKVPFENHKCI